MHSFLPTYLGGTFFPLLDVSEWNIFSGGGCTTAYAPGIIQTGAISQIVLL